MPDFFRVEIPWIVLDDNRDPTWSENFAPDFTLHETRDQWANWDVHTANNVDD